MRHASPCRNGDFNPRSPGGERPGMNFVDFSAIIISIHAPREGSDVRPAKGRCVGEYFNPRSPGGERHPHLGGNFASLFHFNPRSPGGERQQLAEYVAMVMQFQSTLPGRGATTDTRDAGPVACYFNPRSPGGERQNKKYSKKENRKFQSTLPGRGATNSGGWATSSNPGFQSTLPGRGATLDNREETLYHINFNPRSPGGERHFFKTFKCCNSIYFNPRSPGGERLDITNPFPKCTFYFNPRSPGGSDSQAVCYPDQRLRISIHAPREGATGVTCKYWFDMEFQSTLPGRERQQY